MSEGARKPEVLKITLMQRARHLAAAASGGGALLSDANSNSKMGKVTKRRR